MITIEAPYPSIKVTSYYPDAEFGDSRASQAKVQLKRARRGALWSYVSSSDKATLSLAWILTRQKDAEFAELVRVYQTAHWRLTLTDGSQWDVQLIGEPIRRAGTGVQDRNNLRTGDETVTVEVTFSALRLS